MDGASMIFIDVPYTTSGTVSASMCNTSVRFSFTKSSTGVTVSVVVPEACPCWIVIVRIPLTE